MEMQLDVKDLSECNPVSNIHSVPTCAAAFSDLRDDAGGIGSFTAVLADRDFLDARAQQSSTSEHICLLLIANVFQLLRSALRPPITSQQSRSKLVPSVCCSSECRPSYNTTRASNGPRMPAGGRRRTINSDERGGMASNSWFGNHDVELGKKDDDRKPLPASRWRVRSPRYRKRRMLLTLAGCFLLWFILRRIKSSLDFSGYTVQPESAGIDTPVERVPNPVHIPAPFEPGEPRGLPPKESSKDKKDDPFYYDGPIKFYRLARTLHKASATAGYRNTNRNVAFVAANLKSASKMIDMACEMAKWERNYIHFAIMGRDTLSVQEILEVNGVDTKKCDIYWHDARPDYTEHSSDHRARDSVIASLGHIHSFLRPQVVIMDNEAHEDKFLIEGIRAKAKLYTIPVIEVPAHDASKLAWLTRLDSGALRSWDRPSVDILVHAQPESAGSLSRLLKSLLTADYRGLKPPRLIIDLPAEIDPVTREFIEGLTWPPPAYTQSSEPQSSNQLVLHHRISTKRATAEEASVRFLESFYPSHASDSHVLVLSAQTQLSPLFYHYVRYTLLEYMYSSYKPDDAAKLLGISLELPSKHLNGTAELTAPDFESTMANKRYKSDRTLSSVPYLWDAPNSNAALYVGSKWIEMHSFLSYRLAAERELSKKSDKLISTTLPAWTEYALEFLRARGYSMLYPSSMTGESFVTVHNELSHAPEEFYEPPSGTGKDKTDTPAPPNIPDDGILEAETPKDAKSINREPTIFQASRSLHEVLPFSAELPELKDLPHLSYAGDLLSPAESSELSTSYSRRFRQEIGGCEKTSFEADEGLKRKVRERSARDLFCLGDETENDYEEIPPVTIESGAPTRSHHMPENPWHANDAETRKVESQSVKAFGDGTVGRKGT